MTSDKKIVIKINYPNKERKSAPSELGEIEYSTVWNIKRIAGAIAGLCLIAALVGYLWVSLGADKVKSQVAVDSEIIVATTPAPIGNASDKAANTQSGLERPETPKPLAQSPEATAPDAGKQQGTVPQAGQSEIRGNVLRGSLAKFIKGKEPSGNVSLPLVLGKNSAQTLYYFTELKNMAGQEVYHEWLYKDKSVFKRPIKITAQLWRTATHKTIRGTAPGNWSVRLLDAQGDIMHNIDFKVATKNNE